MSNTFIDKINFGKYKVLEPINNGIWSSVFVGKNIKTEERVAMKIEDYIKIGNLLEKETFFLFQLKGKGVPEVKSFGKYGKYKILIETLLGQTLKDIFKNLKGKIPLKDICMIAIQLI